MTDSQARLLSLWTSVMFTGVGLRVLIGYHQTMPTLI